jgi:hypothetical protein
MQSMYELTTAYQNVMELLGDDSIPDEDIAAALSTIDADIETKCSNGIGLLTMLDGQVKAVKEEENRLKSFRIRLEKRKTAILSTYMDGLKKLKRKSVSTPRGDLSIKKNPPAVVIDDAFKISTKYQRQKITIDIDKTKIKADLDAGIKVSGAHLEQGERIAY